MCLMIPDKLSAEARSEKETLTRNYSIWSASCSEIVVFHQSVVAFLLVSVVQDFSSGEPMGTGTVIIATSSAKVVKHRSKGYNLSNKIRKNNSSCLQDLTRTWFWTRICRIIGSLGLEILPFSFEDRRLAK